MSCLTCPGPTLASFPPLMSPPASGPASQPRDQGGGTPGITSHLYVCLGLVSQAEDEDTEATLEDKLVRMAQGDGNDDLMLKVLTHISFCTMHNVLSQALDHKLVLPVDITGQPLKHSLLGAVDLLHHALEALGPSYYTMTYVARHSPQTEELPDVSVILSSFPLSSHQSCSLFLLTLLIPVLCVTVSVVTMMGDISSPCHTSPLPRCQWPIPASQSPQTAQRPRHVKQRIPLCTVGKATFFPFLSVPSSLRAGHGRSEEGDLVSELTAARLWRCLRLSAHGTQTAIFEQTFVKISANQ